MLCKGNNYKSVQNVFFSNVVKFCLNSNPYYIKQEKMNITRVKKFKGFKNIYKRDEDVKNFHPNTKKGNVNEILCFFLFSTACLVIIIINVEFSLCKINLLTYYFWV